MIRSISINNFRSVEKQTVDLAPITFLYGNNAAGKSSLFYSLNVLRNIVSNPNQPLDSFFNLGFANLGSFKQVVFRHDENKEIAISIATKIDNVNVNYGVKIHPKQSSFFIELEAPYLLKLSLPVTFPYPANGNVQESVTLDGITYNVSWNGITAQANPTTVTEESTKKANEIVLLINKTAEAVRTSDIVPLRRGFTKPFYANINVTQFPITEDEVAALLLKEDYIDSKLSTYLEQIIERQFRIKNVSGTAQNALTTSETLSKVSSDIVNDGFGVNQLVYLLAKVLNKNAETVCIEEPEINLHPSVVRKMPRTFFEFVKDENKQLLISTHSETLIISILSAVARNEVSKDEILFYLTLKQDGLTSFNKQEISDSGQVTGGLTSFMAGELEDIDGFFKDRKARKVKKEKVTEKNASQDKPATDEQVTSDQ